VSAFGRNIKICVAALACAALPMGLVSPDASATVHRQSLLLQKAIVNPTGRSDVFGDGVAVWGDRLLVGAPGFNNDTGRAYIYVKSGGVWPAQPTVTLKDPPQQAGDVFGYNEVALYQGTAVVCAFQAYVGQGACYIYVRSPGGIWPANPTHVLRDPTRPSKDGFGFSVAIWQQTIVIGTDNSHSCAAYVYVMSPAHLTCLHNPDEFGFAVAVNANTVVVGDPDITTASGGNGAAYVYMKSAAGWPGNATRVLTSPDPANSSVFGWAVAIDRVAVVVSDQGYQPSGGAAFSGAVYIYNAWVNSSVPARTLFDPANARQDSFGYAVAISGANLVVGAPFGSTAGHSDTAYVFKRVNVWPLVPNASLTDPNSPPGYLGDAVAIQGNVAAIPSPNSTSSSGHTDSGTVYVYGV